MDNIIFTEANDEIKEKICVTWDHMKEWRSELMPEGDDCYVAAALLNGEVVGFASLGPAELISPLNGCVSACIMDIEVEDEFHRKGIGRTLVGMLEDWAKNYGYRQIWAWSSQPNVEAIHMWYALNYGMCPAVMLGKSAIGDTDAKVVGYYVVKMLNPK